MARLKVIGAVAALVVLTGCVGRDIEMIRNAQGTGDAFTKALTEEYREIALFEADQMYDWVDADHFARKGLRAAAGEVVEPEPIDAWKIAADKVDEMSSARSRLVALLDQTARGKVPVRAARAQGRFDCWIEQQEEGHQPDHIAACRDEFYAALSDLETAMAPKPAPAPPPMAKPEPFVVFFAFDSALLTGEAESVIDAAVAAAKKLGVSEFSVTGHADRAGPESYNLKLSLRRANAVKDALVARGVSAGGISVAGRGEAEPAVPTPDGVAEQANRRVEIIIQ